MSFHHFSKLGENIEIHTREHNLNSKEFPNAAMLRPKRVFIHKDFVGKKLIRDNRSHSTFSNNLEN